MTNKKEWIGIHVASFLIGRVAVGTMYPFLTAFFLAAYGEGISSAGMFFCMLLGVLSTGKMVSVVQYSVVILLLVIALSYIQDKYVAENRFVVAALGAVIGGVAQMVRLAVFRELQTQPYIPFFEMALTAGAGIVYQVALSALRSHPWRLAERNETVIGALALFATVLAGIPVTWAGQFSILPCVCVLSVFYGAYRYGLAVGTMLGTICGVLLAVETADIAYLACLALTGLVTGVFRELRKPGVFFGAGLLYAALAFFYQGSMLEPELVRAYVSALLVFVMTPGGVLYQQAYGQQTTIADIAIQKNVLDDFGEQIQAYGQAFEQVSESFKSYNEQPEQDIVFGQMERLGRMITDYAKQLRIETGLTKQQEHKLKTVLWNRQILLNKLVIYKGPNGRQRMYLYASRAKGKVTTARELARQVSAVMKKKFVVDEGSRSIIGAEESLIVLVEAPNFTYQSGYICRRKGGEPVCGDYSYLSPVGRNSMLLMISDGMGSGEPAFRQSEFLTEAVADLIDAGFGRQDSINLVNSLMSQKCQGENFATLDLCQVDLYSGMAEFIKYGAAATFIKRDQWIDTILSTSLPLGAVSEAKADVTMKKLFGEDVIIMCSDGLMDCIDEEDKIARMKEYLCELEAESPEEMASELYRRILQCRPENERDLRDDATLVVFRLKAA